MRTLELALVVLSVFTSYDLVAAQVASSRGTLSVQPGMSVSATRDLPIVRSGRGPAASGSSLAAPSSIIVTGDAGRAYRVTLPTTAVTTEEGVLISDFVVLSDTSGDITLTRAGQLDTSGRDTIRILGRTAGASSGMLINLTTSLPITIDYE